MTELIREIEQADIPKIAELMTRVFGDGDYRQISRLGGMTNHSYRVIRNNGKEYLFRLPGEGTEKLIDRRDERKSTELACSLGIDSELLYFDDDGCKVMTFIKDPQPMDEAVMRREENIIQAANIFNKLHNCGVDTGVRFEVFEMARLYEELIREENVALYSDYEEIKNTVMEIKAEVDKNGAPQKVPCHNDSLIGNWVLDRDGRLYLIDWEYSGMNEAMWDLSCLSIEIDHSPEEDRLLLETYFGREPDVSEKKHFIAAKVYVDYLWTLWGLTRVPFDGKFMQDYADERYERLKGNIDKYRELV